MDLLNKNYDQIVEYLKKKYGTCKKNYFTNSLNKTSGITRTKEGLYIHHIDEDKFIMLSDPKYILNIERYGILDEHQLKLLKIDFQKADRLVYCDLLEHLLLHLKIMENPKPLIPQAKVGYGGVVNFIVPELNDIFSGINYSIPWKTAIANKVIKRKEEYFNLLKYGVKKLDIKIEEYFTSFDYNSHIWNIENNKKLFSEIKNKIIET